MLQECTGHKSYIKTQEEIENQEVEIQTRQ